MSLPQERSTAGLVSYTWVARSRSGSSSFTALALKKHLLRGGRYGHRLHMDSHTRMATNVRCGPTHYKAIKGFIFTIGGFNRFYLYMFVYTCTQNGWEMLPRQ